MRRGSVIIPDLNIAGADTGTDGASDRPAPDVDSRALESATSLAAVSDAGASWDLKKWLRQWWLPLGLALVCCCNLAVVFAADWLPLQDFGGHAQQMDIVARHADAGTIYGELYQVSSLFTANGLELILARILGPTFGAVFLLKLLIAFYVVALPLSLHAVVRAFDRPRWVTFLATPMVFNGTFAMGFIPFTVGLPLAFFALALARRFAVEGGLRRGALLAAVLALTFFAHVIAYLIAITMVAWTLAVFVPGWRAWRRFLPLPCSAPFAVLWIWERFGVDAPTQLGRSVAHSPVVFTSVQERIHMANMWGLDLRRDATDGVATVLVCLVWLLMMALPRRAAPRDEGPSSDGRTWLRAHALELLTLGFVAGYFVLPDFAVHAVSVAPRWLVVALLLFPLWIRVDATGRVARAVAILTFAIACWYPLTVARSFRAFEREVTGGLPEAVGALPDRSSLLFLQWSPGVPSLTRHPEFHLATGLHAVLNGGYSNVSFVGLPYGAVDFAPGRTTPDANFGMPKLPDLASWDAVLVWSFTPPGRALTSNDLTLRWNEGPWWLFDAVRPPYTNLALAGGGGGTVVITACKRGEILTALDVREASSGLAAIRPHCGPVTNGEANGNVVGAANPRTWAGGPGGTLVALRCPDGEWVTAIEGTAGERVQSLGLLCSAGTRLAPVGRPEGRPFTFACPKRSSALGLKLRAGEVIDAIGLACE